MGNLIPCLNVLVVLSFSRPTRVVGQKVVSYNMSRRNLPAKLLLSALALVLTVGSVSEAQAASKTKKKKRTTTTRAPKIDPRTQAIVNQQLAVIFTPRENIVFQTDAQLERSGAASLVSLNKLTGNSFVGFAGRVMTKTDEAPNRGVGFVSAFIGNQSRVNAGTLQGLVDDITIEWAQRSTLQVTPRGIGVTGIDENGDYSAALAVDAFMFLIAAETPAAAVQGARIIGFNLGVTVGSATVAPTPPTTVAAPPPTAAPPVNATADFQRMFAARDAYSFEQTADLDRAMAADLAELNRLTDNLFVAAQARVMYRTASGARVAVVSGYVANPTKITPSGLQRAAASVSADYQNRKTLRVDRGVAFAGTDARGVGFATVAFDSYLFEVVAADRQTAQDAAFVVATNMGARLTE